MELQQVPLARRPGAEKRGVVFRIVDEGEEVGTVRVRLLGPSRSIRIEVERIDESATGPVEVTVR